MKKYIGGILVGCLLIAGFVGVCDLMGVFVFESFRCMPPGWALVTNGSRYSIQEPDGWIWETTSWRTKWGAREQAWFSYRRDIQEAMMQDAEWVLVEEGVEVKEE